jgi:hypothetical protein
MDDALLIQRYWGKAKPETGSGLQWHPLVYHSLTWQRADVNSLKRIQSDVSA